MAKVQIALDEMYDWQEQVLNCPTPNRLLLAARRGGKTLLCRRMAIEDLVRGRKTLWLAPTFDQTLEQFRQVHATVAPLVKFKRQNKEIHTHTGGELWFKSVTDPSRIRSQGFDHVIWDEMAHAKSMDAWTSLRPTLVEMEGSRFTGATTPAGFNHFKDFWDERQDNSDWTLYQFDYTHSPHLTPEKVESLRRDMTSSEFIQEMLAGFIQKSGALFKPEYFDEMLVGKMPETFQRRMMAVDLSLGRLKSDYQCIGFGGVLDQVLYIDTKLVKMDLDALNRVIMNMAEQYNPERICFETNFWMGGNVHAFTRLYKEAGKPIPVIREIDSQGHKETRVSRLAPYLSRGQIKVLDTRDGQRGVGQMRDFPLAKNDDFPDMVDMLIQALNFQKRA